MHILILGAAGMLGRKLVAAITAGGLPATHLTLADVIAPAAPEGIACTAVPAAQAPGGQWRIFIDWTTPEGEQTFVQVFYATA